MLKRRWSGLFNTSAIHQAVPSRARSWVEGPVPARLPTVAALTPLPAGSTRRVASASLGPDMPASSIASRMGRPESRRYTWAMESSALR